MNQLISTQQLNLGYGNELVISDLKLEIDKTKNYFVIGKNGAGKSTLINFISNNFDGNKFNSSFKINFDISVLEIGSEQSLINELTLKENIEYFTKGKIDYSEYSLIVEKYNLNH